MSASGSGLFSYALPGTSKNKFPNKSGMSKVLVELWGGLDTQEPQAVLQEWVQGGNGGNGWSEMEGWEKVSAGCTCTQQRGQVCCLPTQQENFAAAHLGN